MIEGCKHFWSCRGGWIYLCGFICLLELRQHRWQRKWDSSFRCSWSSSQLSVKSWTEWQCRRGLTCCTDTISEWWNPPPPRSVQDFASGRAPVLRCTSRRPPVSIPFPGCCSSGAKWCNRDQLSEPFWKGICRAIRRAFLCLVLDLGRV